MHKEINFSPYANNVLDFIDRDDLVTPTGEAVSITRQGMDFKIQIGAHHSIAYSNHDASYVLNTHQVGING